MNAKATLTDRLVFEQVFHHPLTEITAVTGSFDVYGWAPAGIIVVHKDNPLTQISMKQLDGVFGGARLGGYVGSVWHTEYPYARGPEENIRTWGQLGLTGEWADKPIHVGGQNLSSGAMLSPDLKDLAVQDYDGGPYVKRTLESVRDQTYPLTYHIFFYLNRNPRQPVDPKVREFLHFVLGQEGQGCVQREGRYLPLTGNLVREQVNKLE